MLAPPQIKPPIKKTAAPAGRQVYWQKNQAEKSGNASGILSGLSTTPASQLNTSFGKAIVNSKTALNTQKDEATKLIPTIDEASGSAYAKAQIANTKHKAKSKSANAKNKQNGKRGFIAPLIFEPTIPQKGMIMGGNLNFMSLGSQTEVNAQQAQNALDNIELDTSSIPDSMGDAPILNLDGDSDPNNLHEEQYEQSIEVNGAKNEAAKEVNNDFGENSIIKKPKNNKLKSKKQLNSFALKTKAPAPKAIIKNEALAQLDIQLASTVQSKIGVESDKYDLKQTEYETKTADERKRVDIDIDKEREKSQSDQLTSQSNAQTQVDKSRIEWQNELNKTELDFNTKATAEGNTQRSKITTEQTKGNDAAQTHVNAANREAEAKKVTAQEEAKQEKANSKKSSGGFFGWVADKVSSLISALKIALNNVFDKLRKAVKWVFEQAKKLALAALELARKAIVGLIKAFGEFLKGLVNIVFAAFPSIRDRINAKIDTYVNKAEELVNKAFEFFKKAVSAILDALASFVDAILGALQAFYNLVLDVVAFIVKGIIALIEGMSNLVFAAIDSPSHFWSQVSVELIGQDITNPLPNEIGYDSSKDETQIGNGFETIKHTKNILGMTEEEQNPSILESDSLKSEDIINTDIEHNLAISPELSRELSTMGDGEKEFGHTTENTSFAENSNNSTQDNQMTLPSSNTQSVTDGVGKVGPFKSAFERGEYVFTQVKAGIKDWWSKNQTKVIIGLVAGLAAGIVLEVVTGGAITAAIPILLELVAVIFAVQDLIDGAVFIGQYLTNSWAGKIAIGAMNLARAFVKIVIALVFDLIGGGEMLKGVKGGTKAVQKGGIKGGMAFAKASTAKGFEKTIGAFNKGVNAFNKAKGVTKIQKLGNIVKGGGSATIKNGKLFLNGIKGGLKQGAKTLDEMVRGLLTRFRIKKFKIIVRKFRFYLFAEVNPWVLLASGDVIHVEANLVKGKKVGDDFAGGILIGIREGDDASKLVKKLLPTSEMDDIAKESLKKEGGTLFKELEDKTPAARNAEILGGMPSERVSLRKKVEDDIWAKAKTNRFDNNGNPIYKDGKTQLDIPNNPPYYPTHYPELTGHGQPHPKAGKPHPQAGQPHPQAGKPRADIGHVSGEEWHQRLQNHKKAGRTREEIVEIENNAELYAIEERSSNRSRKLESIDNLDD